MAIEVQAARVENASALVELYHRTYKQNKQMGFPSSILECDSEDVSKWIQDRTVFVAIQGNKIVGAVQIIPRPKWGSPEIGRLAVSPDHQEQGMGRTLLRYAEEHVKEDHESVRLRTFSGHPFLEDWYRQEGYERIGVERFSNSPYDAHVMEKEL